VVPEDPGDHKGGVVPEGREAHHQDRVAHHQDRVDPQGRAALKDLLHNERYARQDGDPARPRRSCRWMAGVSQAVDFGKIGRRNSYNE